MPKPVREYNSMYADCVILDDEGNVTGIAYCKMSDGQKTQYHKDCLAYEDAMKDWHTQNPAESLAETRAWSEKCRKEWKEWEYRRFKAAFFGMREHYQKLGFYKGSKLPQ